MFVRNCFWLVENSYSKTTPLPAQLCEAVQAHPSLCPTVCRLSNQRKKKEKKKWMRPEFLQYFVVKDHRITVQCRNFVDSDNLKGVRLRTNTNTIYSTQFFPNILQDVVTFWTRTRSMNLLSVALCVNLAQHNYFFNPVSPQQYCQHYHDTCFPSHDTGTSTKLNAFQAVLSSQSWARGGHAWESKIFVDSRGVELCWVT